MRRWFVDVHGSRGRLMDVAQWEDLAAEATAASFAPELMTDDDERGWIVEVLDSLAGSVDEQHRRSWVLLADRLGRAETS